MTTSSWLPAIRSKAADHLQAPRLLLSTSYFQGCGRRVFPAQQQKRSVFQERLASNVGDLVYKNRNRYYYYASYVMVSVTVVIVAANLALLMSGYRTTADVDEATVDSFVSVALVFSIVLYFFAYALLTRTVFFIYYNESTRRFLAVTYNWCMARKNVVFKPGEVKLVENSAGFRQFVQGSYRIFNHPYHITGRDFVSRRHYNLMLGFIEK